MNPLPSTASAALYTPLSAEPFNCVLVTLIPTRPPLVVETLRVASLSCKGTLLASTPGLLSPPTKNALSTVLSVLLPNTLFVNQLLLSNVLPLINAVPTTSKLARGSVANSVHAFLAD